MCRHSSLQGRRRIGGSRSRRPSYNGPWPSPNPAPLPTRAALEALSTDPDVYDKSAVNSIWEDVLDATERLEKMIGIDGTP